MRVGIVFVNIPNISFMAYDVIQNLHLKSQGNYVVWHLNRCEDFQ